MLRDGQQFIAPLALAEALGAGLLASWAARPRTPAASRAATPAVTPSRTPAASRAATPAVARPRASPAVREDGNARAAANRAGLAIAVALLLAPVLLLPGLAWGAAGRLRPVWYPSSWLNAARLIDGSPARGQGAAAALDGLPAPGLERRPGPAGSVAAAAGPAGDLERRAAGGRRPDAGRRPRRAPAGRRHRRARPAHPGAESGRSAVRGRGRRLRQRRCARPCGPPARLRPWSPPRPGWSCTCCPAAAPGDSCGRT